MYWNVICQIPYPMSWWININMRCIEITMGADYYPSTGTININMRCIEIQTVEEIQGYDSWLTLTWDVLKFAFPFGGNLFVAD